MAADVRRTVLLALVIAIAASAQAAAQTGTSISGGPSGGTRDATPTFAFRSDEPGATFECKVEGPGQAATWASCRSPLTLQLADGSYVLSVRAVDAAGNVDPTPARRSFSVDTGAVATFIDAGPSGVTNDPTPSFTFGSPVTGATFECRIDGPGTPVGAFTACSSPWRAPRLASGGYVLQVRALAPGGAVDLTPASRAFTVDADAPETTIVDGPGEGGSSPSRTPAFRYQSEAGATFECRVDNRVAGGVDTVAWAPCPPTGYQTLELDGGRHEFEVRGKDQAGNVDRSPAQRSFLVSVCEPVVRFGLVEAEGECLRSVGTGEARRWESKKPIKLNGLDIPVSGSSKIVLEAGTPQRPDGTLSIKNLTLEVAGIRLFRGDVTLTLPDGKVGETRHVVRFDLGKQAQTLLGLDIAGSAALSLARPSDNTYKSILSLELVLPSIFRTAPNAGGALTGRIAIDIDRAGAHVNGAKIEVKDAYIGNLGVKNVCLSFLAGGATSVERCKPHMGGSDAPDDFECASDATRDRWDGALSVVLPTPSGTVLGAWAGLSGGAFSYAGAFADKLGNALPIVPGVFLEKVALEVCVNPPPFQVAGDAIIAFGPEVAGKRAVAIEGAFRYVDGHDGKPWTLTTRGALKLFDAKALEGYVITGASGAVDFGFGADLAFGPVTLKGKVEGWVEPDTPAGRGGRAPGARVAARDRDDGGESDPGNFPPPKSGGGGGGGGGGAPAAKGRFSVSGEVKLCLNPSTCAQAEAVISSLGLAGCITVGIIPVPSGPPVWVGPQWYDWKIPTVDVPVQAGAGYTWGAPGVELMGGSCSIARWKLARVAQLGPPTGFEVRGDPGAVAIRVHGDGGPPRFVLIGPDGRRIASPPLTAGEIAVGSHLLAENPDDATTAVMIVNPAAGSWTVEPLPGSTAIRGIDQAGMQRAPIVAAHVVGRGHNRAIDYMYAPARGQRITFVERGPRAQLTLGIASGRRCPRGVPHEADGRALRCAAVRFAPADGPAGRRRILALVEQDGRPRTEVEVTTYVAPPPLRPAKPRGLRLRRVGGGVRVSWRRSRNAARVNVVARVADGRRRLFIRDGRARAVRIAAVRRKDGVRVTVRGMRLDGRQGRPATARLKPRSKESRR